MFTVEDGDPDQQMEPRSASPQHEVEQSRGPVQEKQERLASVEVEANEQFVLSTMWSATESSPGDLLDILLLVAKVLGWGLNGAKRYVLLRSGVHSVIVDIPSSIAHLASHSADLILQTCKTLFQLQVV